LAPFAYGTDKVIGVNLGGWFVLEPWITPSIFEGTNNSAIVDEYTFGQFQDPNVALNTLKNHWATWITESKHIKVVTTPTRIPFGYWSIPTGEPVSPFIPGAWPYLMQALQWARNHGIHVIVDLHGAPGSQNGYDNSGQRTGNPVWALNPDNITRTINDLVFLANATQGMIDILEFLNEPIAFQSDAWASAVRGFWQNAYTAVRNAVGGGLTMMIGDGFLGVDSWQNFLTYPSAEGVLMD
ncbi:glycoside hydrolase, partial [Sistotremastrum suecicum HHB10207 ss-3]